MRLLRSSTGEAHPDVTSLPNQLSTIKNRVSAWLPLLDMRCANIPLTTEKLPTEKPSDKELARASETPTIAPLHFIDPTKLFRRFMATSETQKMHRGMAHFVDLPTEL